MRKAVMVMALCAMSGAALAQETESGFEFGVGLGRGTMREEVDGFVFKDKSTPFKIFGGYRANRYIAAELAFMDRFKGKVSEEEASIEVDAQGLQASLMASLPLGEYFDLYVRAGMVAWESTSVALFDGEELDSIEQHGTEPMFGVGIAAWLDNAQIRLEHELTEIDNVTDISLTSLSISWFFR